jgi:mRNA interferase MazF
VLVHFPFSDLSASKLRPAVVLARASDEDHVLCQVTGSDYSDPAAIRLDESDFAAGSLQRASFARPGKLFTASITLMAREVGQLKHEALARLIEGVIAILRPTEG